MPILATVDGSSDSFRVLPHAARLAYATGTDLLVLRVIDPHLDIDDDESAPLAEAIEHLSASKTAEIEAHLAGLELPASVLLEVRGRRDDTAAAILRAAEQTGAQLIAMATHGAGLARSSVLGSVATDVMGRTSVPLMLAGEAVRPPHDPGPYHIVITSDGSPAAEAALPAARRLLERAPVDRVRLTLLRIYRPAFGDPPASVAIEQCRRELSAFRRHAPRRFPLELELREERDGWGADRSITEAARELGASAIWMASHGHSFSRRVLLGSVAMSTVRGADVPVIVTRAER